MKNENPFRILVNLPPSFFTHPLLSPQFERLSQLGELRTASHNSVDEILPDLRWAQAIIMWAWPVLREKELEAAPDLVFMGQINTTQAAVSACLTKGIAISEVRHCWSPAVAEMALTLILTGLRKVSEYHMRMRTGTEKWVIDFPDDIDVSERELTRCSVGIIGFGGIGRRLAKLLNPFNVDLYVYDPYVPMSIIEEYSAQQVPLSQLIQSCEVVVLAAANNEGSRHLIGKHEIDGLRRNAVLVNVGRSMLVDMQALQERLSHGDLIAMIDVFDQEPLEADSPLRSLPNTYLTPHRAGGIMSSAKRALTFLANDLEAFLQDKPRKFAVTEEMLVCFREG